MHGVKALSAKAVMLLSAALMLVSVSVGTQADSLSKTVQKDYERYLENLFDHFHRHPELSLMEHATAARLASELRDAGFTVTEGVGGTGVVGLLENGPGPTVMMRADMDGLPVEEKSGLPNASRAKQLDWDGNEVFVMHACGHDVHITSLVGTARYMSNHRDEWTGTLMLIGQPAEEKVAGARAMMADKLWERFGMPDYGLAFHVTAGVPTGKLIAVEGSPYSGSISVDVVIPGVGAHGAYPHQGIDPVVLGSQIVLGLQTVVSRSLPPREPGVITVGSFHAGTKHNIISDQARLQLSVRSESTESRDLLLDGIQRVAENMGRVAGLPEDNLPHVIISQESVPPTLNNIPLTSRLRRAWQEALGEGVLYEAKRLGMGAEDFPFFVTDPYIPSTYFKVGGTPQRDIDVAEKGGTPVASHHSPLFKIDAKGSVTLGVEATVVALKELMPAQR